MSDAERAVAFLRAGYLGVVEQVDEHPWGLLLRTPSLPLVWDANLALLDRWQGSPARLHVELDRVQREAGLRHRKTAIHDESLAARVWPELAEPDWPFRNRYLVMTHRSEPDREAAAAIEVLELAPDAYADAHAEGIRLEPYGRDEELVRQLLELDRRVARLRRTTYLAALADGRPVAYASLYEADGVAQVEDVLTLPDHRGQGLARAVVLEAVRRARANGAGLVFLVADADDWPRHLYARLGFEPVAVEHLAGRPSETVAEV